jgi:hypothetical protein
MKAWAESFGNLDYDVLKDFMIEFHDKIITDANKDMANGRKRLASKLLDLADYVFEVYCALEDIARLCLPFNKEQD